MKDIIQVTYSELAIKFDDEVMKAVQQIGINIDKEELLKALELADKLVRCAECKWYTKPHIKYNNGKKKYFDSEAEIEYVTTDTGINVGGKCAGHKTFCVAHDRVNPDDYAELVIFRRTDDYCSYGKRRENE